jgi:hypothetical protein
MTVKSGSINASSELQRLYLKGLSLIDNLQFLWDN